MRWLGFGFEKRARRYLERRGLRTLMANYGCRGGEVDLVMLDVDTVTFVEVRYRRRKDFGGAAASVTRTKQQRLIRAARHFLRAYPHYGRQTCRFDVLAIDGAFAPQYNWIKDAFTL